MLLRSGRSNSQKNSEHTILGSKSSIKKSRSSKVSKPSSLVTELPSEKLSNSENGSLVSAAKPQLGDAKFQFLTKSIKLQNHLSEEIALPSLIDGSKGLVLFYYPKANTPGCTKQANEFNSRFSEFQRLNYSIYGFSADKPETQKRFAEKYNFKYQLLSDIDNQLSKALKGVKNQKPVRSHWIFDKHGDLLDQVIGVSPTESTELAFKTIS